VWIGFNCTILKGVTIGKGSIIASNSVVTKNVEPMSLMIGNPAKFVRKLE
jgi:acetyltransferase-like isoleucine patch superfamily enzyme